LTRGPIKCAKTKTTATIVKAVLVHTSTKETLVTK